ncbi:hypothetical protein F5Y15DRAFT_413419 [Xylariaceae sp. FL0016]|nr:hypothetical protein F5Y15DRAFT_413419 [Xylariaceae sp. FL0016]
MPSMVFSKPSEEGVLYIDGGIQSFSDQAPYEGTTDNFDIAVNMSLSCDWKTNVTEVVLNKTTDLQTPNDVPIVQPGALFRGLEDDLQIYLYRGVTPDINTSLPGFQAPTLNQYTFTYNDGYVPESIEGIVVLDLKNQTATNRSTDTISNGDPRIRGGMLCIPQIGTMRVLNQSLQPVSMNQVKLFDVDSISQADDPDSNNGWYTQAITGKSPSPRVDFCVVMTAARDNSSFNIHLYGGWDFSLKSTSTTSRF